MYLMQDIQLMDTFTHYIVYILCDIKNSQSQNFEKKSQKVEIKFVVFETNYYWLIFAFGPCIVLYVGWLLKWGNLLCSHTPAVFGGQSDQRHI